MQATTENKASGGWAGLFTRGARGRQELQAELAACQEEAARCRAAAQDARGKVDALERSLAVIEFELDGTIITANDNFLEVMGYTLDEIRGRHHSMFVDPELAASDAYRRGWEALARGEFHSAEYKRIAKGGRDVWIQATYNPILDADGKPCKVVKFATDITAVKLERAYAQSQIEAIHRSQAVVEFEPDGTIITANDNFLAAVGYKLDEIRGKHHAMFVEPDEAASAEYAQFWERLRRGEHDAAEYRRLGKGGQEVWIQATYNPVRDLNGKVAKVVKFAVDVTQQKRGQRETEAMLADAKQVMSKIASGDLSSRVNGTYEGDFAMLAAAINGCAEKLTEVVTSIHSSAATLSNSAHELSEGNTNLSQRTEEQASSLEETASSMEQMTSTVSQNADNANQANQLARSAREQAETGGEVVGQAVTAMNAINDSSRKISDIIGVIDEIAFQTNLLALNASVEAARAGEQGRGFAVVASEVRNLAGRSATAAKEIKELIEDSGRKVDEGSRLVNQSGATLEEIVTSVKKVTDIVAEIAAASHEQSAGIEQVNKAMMQMDDMTQQNAALVEEAAAASQAINEQSSKLTELMAFFSIGGDGAAVAPSAVRGERRSAERPWSDRESVAAPAEPAPAVPAPARVAIAGGGVDDQDWEEF